MRVDRSGWSGDGDVTQAIIDRLARESGVAHLTVEDAPASREDTGFAFISSELFIRPVVRVRRDRVWRWGWWPSRRRIATPDLRLDAIEARLTADPEIGAPGFADLAMLQYLRTLRIVPAYQTRGYKLVELIRLYLVPVEGAD